MPEPSEGVAGSEAGLLVEGPDGFGLGSLLLPFSPLTGEPLNSPGGGGGPPLVGLFSSDPVS